ncbi:MAG: hypothetical protein AB7I33_15565 [Gemmatimonadales bacterium]
MPQSTFPFRRLPACFLLFSILVLVSPLTAQERVRTKAGISIRREPNGAVLGTLNAGNEFQIRKTDGGWVEVRLEGWVWNRSLANTSRDGFDLMVSPKTENLRDAPNGTILGRLEAGALLNRVEGREGWTRVRRDVWLPSTGLSQVGGAAPSGALASTPDPGGDASALEGGQLEAAAPARLFLAPGGDSIGRLDPGARATVLSRSGEWVRIRVDAWVRENETRAVADSGVLFGVTAAEVRAAPSKYVGRTVEWRVQYLSIQEADELRPEIPKGSLYLLTRGPLPEVGFVYLILSPEQVARFRSLPPLQEITVRAVIRAASTRYLPNPVAQLVDVVEGG